eukprot:1281521-Rhodomonas_salina.3
MSPDRLDSQQNQSTLRGSVQCSSQQRRSRIPRVGHHSTSTGRVQGACRSLKRTNQGRLEYPLVRNTCPLQVGCSSPQCRRHLPRPQRSNSTSR